MMKKLRYLLVILGWIGLTHATFARVRLPALISDGMILQRNQQVNIWGWADPGEQVRVTLNGVALSAVTGVNGKWKTQLPAQPAGGPFELTIEGKNKITIHNILFGDVWVCSGQSNMEYILKRSAWRYPNEIASADNPQIRQFLVKSSWSYQLKNDVQSNGWKAATPESVLDFTAVGYFFARSLYERYHVPIGLINSSYGGTPVEGWMSEDALAGFPELLKTFQAYKDTAKVNAVMRANKTMISDWYKNVAEADAGRDSISGQPLWASTPINTAEWQSINVPGFWEEQSLPKTDGVVWYKKDIDIPQHLAGKSATLNLGNIFNEDSTYFNGVKVGSTSSQYLGRNYTVPGQLIKAGKNNITLRIINKEGNGGFLKDKPYNLHIDGTTISLAGSWYYKPGAAVPPLESAKMKQFAKEPGVLYNAMIAPLVNYNVKGVIWYQGEGNTSGAQTKQYSAQFHRLIADWRAKWHHGNFPFLYVQLANYLPINEFPKDSHWAELREAQLQTLDVPKTGMAVILDTGEWNDVHPSNKKDPGQRLALAAQHVAYGDNNVEYSGPLYQSSRINGNKIIINFKHSGKGLVAKGGELKQFAIAGADKKFVRAKAIIKGNTVMVWSDQIIAPVAVRYAWADNPYGANLFNKDGLPASPFRTDNW